VGVVRLGQAEVALAVDRVFGAGQAAQEGRRPGGRVGAPGEALEDCGELLAVGGDDLEDAGLAQDLAGLGEAAGLGLRVDAVELCQAGRGEGPAGGLVGGEHALLDEPMGVILFHRGAAGDAALAIEFQAYLGRGQLEGAIGAAAFAQSAGEGGEGAHRLQGPAVQSGAGRLRAVVQGGEGLGVGQAPARAQD